VIIIRVAGKVRRMLFFIIEGFSSLFTACSQSVIKAMIQDALSNYL
jgi:hypothetical protein